VQSLGRDGQVLASSHALSRLANCGVHHPVATLPPGVVTLAHAASPQGPIALQLQRIRFLGHMSLCMGQRPFGGQQCARYPIGPASNQDIGNAPLWVMAGGDGSCKPPRFQVIEGIVLRRGLTPWLRTPSGLRRMSTAAVPTAFGAPGPLFYAVLTRAPDTIELRNAAGRTVFSRSVLTPVPRGYCGGLNPDQHT
jgi:hypothetical protein